MITTELETQEIERAAASPTHALQLLYKELAICDYIEATERKKAALRFLVLIDMVLKEAA
jgi:hypothetical protein